jgi:hypothetical protein
MFWNQKYRLNTDPLTTAPGLSSYLTENAYETYPKRIAAIMRFLTGAEGYQSGWTDGHYGVRSEFDKMRLVIKQTVAGGEKYREAVFQNLCAWHELEAGKPKLPPLRFHVKAASAATRIQYIVECLMSGEERTSICNLIIAFCCENADLDIERAFGLATAIVRLRPGGTFTTSEMEQLRRNLLQVPSDDSLRLAHELTSDIQRSRGSATKAA